MNTNSVYKTEPIISNQAAYLEFSGYRVLNQELSKLMIYSIVEKIIADASKFLYQAEFVASLYQAESVASILKKSITEEFQ